MLFYAKYCRNKHCCVSKRRIDDNEPVEDAEAKKISKLWSNGSGDYNVCISVRY